MGAPVGDSVGGAGVDDGTGSGGCAAGNGDAVDCDVYAPCVGVNWPSRASKFTLGTGDGFRDDFCDTGSVKSITIAP